MSFFVPGRIGTRTGGSIYDRRIAEGLRTREWPVEIVELHESFPFPIPGAVDEARERLASVPDDAIAIVDSLILGVIPDHIERTASRLPVVALIHLPLAADPALDPDTASRLEAGEKRALAAASKLIVTGEAAVEMLARYELPRDRIEVIEPGTDRRPIARGPSGGGDPVRLLSVATLNPGKGHEILVRALSTLVDLDWRLTCAGSLTRDPATADRVRATIELLGLHDRIELAGDLETTRLERLYDVCDVFVLATLRETYGMAVAEALAHGLPVVSTMTGAIPALVGQTAGVIVPPGDEQALSRALRHVIGDAALRAHLSAGARIVRDRLPSWDDAVDRFAAALTRVPANA